MSITENKNVVLRFNKEFIEGGNVEVLKEIVAENFINHTAAPNVAKDVNGLISFIKMLHIGFPDLKVEIQDQIGEGDMVCTRKVFHATHLGEIMGKPATGKKVVINVIDMVRVIDGKYVDHWGKNDTMQVIQSL